MVKVLSKELETARSKYCDLMIDAMIRIKSISDFNSGLQVLPSALVKEYSILQVRMVCEIVALGCLVAHGDLIKRAPEKIRTAFAPGEIFSLLEKLHEGFFPAPYSLENMDRGFHLAEYKGPPCATRSEVKQIWDQCGSGLHKGSLKNLLRERGTVQLAFPDVDTWSEKLKNLIMRHQIQTIDNKYVFVTQPGQAKIIDVVIGMAVPKPTWLHD